MFAIRKCNTTVGTVQFQLWFMQRRHAESRSDKIPRVDCMELNLNFFNFVPILIALIFVSFLV